MSSVRNDWLIYTVVIGLVPFIVRIFIYLIVSDVGPTYILNEVDMIAFGLVLNVSNITELQNNSRIPEIERRKNFGMSVILVIIFSIFLGISYAADLPGMDRFNSNVIKLISLLMAIASFTFSYSIFKRIV